MSFNEYLKKDWWKLRREVFTKNSSYSFLLFYYKNNLMIIPHIIPLNSDRLKEELKKRNIPENYKTESLYISKWGNSNIYDYNFRFYDKNKKTLKLNKQLINFINNQKPNGSNIKINTLNSPKQTKHLVYLRFNKLPIRKSIRAECINHDIAELWFIAKLDDIDELSAKLYSICESTFKQSKEKRYHHFINKMRQLKITFDSNHKESIFNEFKENCYITYGIHPLDELNIYKLGF